MTGVLDYELRGLEKLSVITPGINTDTGVDHSEGTEVNGLGGRLRSLSQSLVGPLTEAALERMTFDRVPLGAGDGACEADHIKTRLSPWPGAGVLSICWADSSKLGPALPRMSRLCTPMDLVADDGADPEQVQKFRHAGYRLR